MNLDEEVAHCFSDKEIQQTLEAMNEEMVKRLDSLEDTMAQQNTTGECPMETTGSFLNPADNCSHILHNHPQSTSGMTVFVVHQNKILKFLCTQVITGCRAPLAMQ